jgi:hypothetical protein
MIDNQRKNNPLWRELSDYYLERLSVLRAQNDAPKTNDDTAMLRGRIAECKAFLALADEKPLV